MHGAFYYFSVYLWDSLRDSVSFFVLALVEFIGKSSWPVWKCKLVSEPCPYLRTVHFWWEIRWHFLPGLQELHRVAQRRHRDAQSFLIIFSLCISGILCGALCRFLFWLLLNSLENHRDRSERVNWFLNHPFLFVLVWGAHFFGNWILKKLRLCRIIKTWIS